MIVMATSTFKRTSIVHEKNERDAHEPEQEYENKPLKKLAPLDPFPQRAYSQCFPLLSDHLYPEQAGSSYRSPQNLVRWFHSQ